ncbi:hypothetical protein CDD83_10981 [Cordyceps sp. RAO-2017]|nr:hypothetical protein CDD83_10981 [Cordyceps sp. RAO-2017]
MVAVESVADVAPARHSQDRRVCSDRKFGSSHSRSFRVFRHRKIQADVAEDCYATAGPRWQLRAAQTQRRPDTGAAVDGLLASRRSSSLRERQQRVSGFQSSHSPPGRPGRRVSGAYRCQAVYVSVVASHQLPSPVPSTQVPLAAARLDSLSTYGTETSIHSMVMDVWFGACRRARRLVARYAGRDSDSLRACASSEAVAALASGFGREEVVVVESRDVGRRHGHQCRDAAV